jgi:hypothetical protein
MIAEVIRIDSVNRSEVRGESTDLRESGFDKACAAITTLWELSADAKKRQLEQRHAEGKLSDRERNALHALFGLGGSEVNLSQGISEGNGGVAPLCKAYPHAPCAIAEFNRWGCGDGYGDFIELRGEGC